MALAAVSSQKLLLCYAAEQHVQENERAAGAGHHLLTVAPHVALVGELPVVDTLQSHPLDWHLTRRKPQQHNSFGFK